MYGYKVYCTINTPVFTHTVHSESNTLYPCSDVSIYRCMGTSYTLPSMLCIVWVQGILYYQYTSLHTQYTRNQSLFASLQSTHSKKLNRTSTKCRELYQGSPRMGTRYSTNLHTQYTRNQSLFASLQSAHRKKLSRTSTKCRELCQWSTRCGV